MFTWAGHRGFGLRPVSLSTSTSNVAVGGRQLFVTDALGSHSITLNTVRSYVIGSYNFATIITNNSWIIIIIIIIIFIFLLLLLDADFVNNKTCTDEVTVVLTKLQMIYQSLEQSVFSNNELLSWHELLQWLQRLYVHNPVRQPEFAVKPSFSRHRRVLRVVVVYRTILLWIQVDKSK